MSFQQVSHYKRKNCIDLLTPLPTSCTVPFGSTRRFLVSRYEKSLAKGWDWPTNQSGSRRYYNNVDSWEAKEKFWPVDNHETLLGNWHGSGCRVSSPLGQQKSWQRRRQRPRVWRRQIRGTKRERQWRGMWKEYKCGRNFL